MCNGVVNPNPSHGQLNVTQAEYDAIVLTQLRELWTNYGPLDELCEYTVPLVCASMYSFVLLVHCTGRMCISECLHAESIGELYTNCFVLYFAQGR